jgi:tetratricopeptide (TPR) repeat protein
MEKIKKRVFKKEEYIEKYEREFYIYGIIVFIILCVLSSVFLGPKLFGFYSYIYPKTEKTENNEVYGDNKSKNQIVTNYKSGVDSFHVKNYSSALVFFEKALEENPKDINYLTEYAITNYMLKNYNEAISAYEKIIKIDSNNSFAYNSIGNIYWIMENYNLAEENFKKAIEIDPKLITAYNNFALMLDDKGEKTRALEILNKGIEANPDASDLKIAQKIIE